MDEGISVKEALRLYGDALDSRRIVVGHNVLHDLKMMRAEMRLVGYPDRFMETRYICTMQGSRQAVDARTADGKKKAPRLEEACAFFNIPLEEKGAHTGIGGAERALEILRRLHRSPVHGPRCSTIDPTPSRASRISSVVPARTTNEQILQAKKRAAQPRPESRGDPADGVARVPDQRRDHARQ
jgi:DNA polymerase III epsilon subunit-like protein